MGNVSSEVVEANRGNENILEDLIFIAVNDNDHINVEENLKISGRSAVLVLCTEKIRIVLPNPSDVVEEGTGTVKDLLIIVVVVAALP